MKSEKSPGLTPFPFLFRDAQVEALDLSTSADVQELIEVHLCGRPANAELTPSDQELLSAFVEKAREAGVTFEQFNELLLVLNQDRVSHAFFDFFFVRGDKDQQRSFEQFRQGVICFKGFAMICFGNFRFAFRRLSTAADCRELQAQLGACYRVTAEIEAAYDSRPSKVLDTTLIQRDHTWFVGEITGEILAKELRRFEKYRKACPGIANDAKAIAFGE